MSALFFGPSSFLPAISDTTLAFVRVAYGVLLAGTLLQALPQARRFFLSERWGGYAQSSRAVDAIQNTRRCRLVKGGVLPRNPRWILLRSSSSDGATGVGFKVATGSVIGI